MSDNQVFAFEVSVVDAPWPGQIINHRTRGKAKAAYYSELQDCWPDIPFTALRARKIGQPQSSAQFIRNAEYRRLPEMRCGQRVTVGKARGVIVGHNSSANFDVLFDDDSPRYPGEVLNVHPSEITKEQPNG